MRGRVKSREIVEHGRVGLLVIVVVVVVARGGSGRRAAVDEGGVDHRQVEAGRKHVDVRVAAHGVQGGRHPVEGERQAGAELKLRVTQDERTLTERGQPTAERPPDGGPRAVPGRVAVLR